MVPFAGVAFAGAGQQNRGPREGQKRRPGDEEPRKAVYGKYLGTV